MGQRLYIKFTTCTFKIRNQFRQTIQLFKKEPNFYQINFGIHNNTPI